MPIAISRYINGIIVIYDYCGFFCLRIPALGFAAQKDTIKNTTGFLPSPASLIF